MRLHPNLLDRLPPARRPPRNGRLSFWVGIHVQRDRLERLRDPRNDNGRFVVGELLAKTDARASVEGKENERVGNEVSLDAVIEESIGIEFVRCGRNPKVQFQCDCII